MKEDPYVRVGKYDLSRNASNGRGRFDPKVTPHSGYLLGKDGSLTEFNLHTNPQGLNKLEFFHPNNPDGTLNGIFAAVMLWLPKYKEYTCFWKAARYVGQERLDGTDIEKLKKGIFAKQQEELEYIDKVENDLVFAYEEALRKHDWYYTYSDDGGVFRAGENSSYRIRTLGKKIPEEDQKRLWNQYCPWAKEEK
ncbi:MAG: hypothetical protein ACWGQW_03315 [bacterium]